MSTASINRTTGLSCLGSPCGATSWALSGEGCTGGAAIPDGDSIALTAGAGSEYHINIEGVAGTTGLDCTLTATITDAYNRSVSKALTFSVRARAAPPHICPRLHPCALQAALVDNGLSLQCMHGCRSVRDGGPGVCAGSRGVVSALARRRTLDPCPLCTRPAPLAGPQVAPMPPTVGLQLPASLLVLTGDGITFAPDGAATACPDVRECVLMWGIACDPASVVAWPLEPEPGGASLTVTTGANASSNINMAGMGGAWRAGRPTACIL